MEKTEEIKKSKGVHRFRYMLNMCIYLLVPYIAGFILFRIYPQYYFTIYPFTIIFFIALGMLFFAVFRNSEKMSPRQFVGKFLIFTFFKFLLSALLIVIYAWIEREKAILFVIVYFVSYIVLSVYDIVAFKRISVKGDVK